MSSPFKNDRVGLQTRNSNPFSMSKIINDLDRQRAKKIYENLEERTAPTKSSEKETIDQAVAKLKSRIGNSGFIQRDFGKLELVELQYLDINIDNQRDIDWVHVAYIIETFDPRASQVVNTILLPNGRYSVPEGQHTAVALYILYKLGIIDQNFKVQCKVIDALATVPGSKLKGEAFGNWLFRIINYKGRKAVDPFFMHRSRVSGVRNYESTLREDVHSEELQIRMEKYNMYPRPAIEARGHGAKPGMVTYITGVNKVGGWECDDFEEKVEDFDFACKLHDRYFANEKGVDGGFILALGRYAELARKEKLTITAEWEQALMAFFKQKYASPNKFHKSCKTRLDKFNKVNDLPTGWSDNCLLSVLILDFYQYCDKNDLNFPPLPDKHINKYNGI